jgi:hypothetical protein
VFSVVFSKFKYTAQCRRKFLKFRKKYFGLLVWLSLVFFMSACGTATTVSNSTPPAPTLLSPTTSPTTNNSPAITSTPIISATSIPVNSPLPTLTVSPTVDWQYRWLAGIPCYLPCWEGIRPGQTAAKEALRLLEKVSFVKEVKVLDTRDGIINGTASWKWQSTNGPYKTDGELQFINKEGTQIVGQIVIFYEKSFKLGEIIQSLGNPTYVSASLGIGEIATNIYAYTTKLYFVKYGFVLYLSSKTKLLIDQDTLFNIVQINNYDPFGYNNSPSLPAVKDRQDLLVPWQGYNNFDFYCRAGYGQDGKRVGDCSEIYKTAS